MTKIGDRFSCTVKGKPHPAVLTATYVDEHKLSLQPDIDIDYSGFLLESGQSWTFIRRGRDWSFDKEKRLRIFPIGIEKEKSDNEQKQNDRIRTLIGIVLEQEFPECDFERVAQRIYNALYTEKGLNLEAPK